MIRWFVEHKTAANMIMVLLVVLGYITIPNIRRETMPDFTLGQVSISVAYPGSTAEEAEEAVCVPIEEALDGVSGIDEITSNAMEGSAVVTVDMVDGLDYQEFYNDIKTEIEGIDSFPEEVERITIKPRSRTDHVVSIGIAGKMSPPHLKAYCHQLKESIERGVNGAQVSIEGFSQHEYRIEIPQNRLEAFGLSVSDIARVIKTQNTDLSAGILETDNKDIVLRFSERRRDVRSLADMKIVSGKSGAEITLGALGKITDNFEKDEQKVIINGQRAGIVNVVKAKSFDSLNIFEGVKKIVEEARKTAPPGVEFIISRNVASIVQDRLDMLIENGIQGVILVFFTLWFFLNIRLSFWVAMGLPISFVGGMFFLNLFGVTVNMISMMALLVAIGLLMDDAIVLSENIAVHISKGDNAMEAAIQGVKEVTPGVLSSFGTTACVFCPLMFLSGRMGMVLSVIPVTLLIVLSVSLVEAFFIMPNHLGHSFKHGKTEPWKLRIKIDSTIDYIRNDLIAPAVRVIIPNRYIFLGIMAGLFIISVSMVPAGVLKYVAFPEIDGDIIVCKVLMPQGTPLEASEKAAAKIVSALQSVNEEMKSDQPGGKDLVQTITIQFAQNPDARESGGHLFTVVGDLLPGAERKGRINAILDKWRQKTGIISGADIMRFQDFSPGPGGNPIEVRLRGKDLKSLKAAAIELRQKLSTYDGVFDISDDMRSGKPEISMKLLPGAMKLGLSVDSIARQVRAAFFGEKADELQIGKENIEYNVKLEQDPKNNIQRFDNFRVNLPDKRKVPLSAIVDMKTVRGLSSIKRINRLRTVTVTADVVTSKANSSEVIRDLQKTFFPGLIKKHEGVSISYGGAEKRSRKTGSSMGKAFSMGLLGIFILLTLQFGSYMEAMAVMAAIPMAIIGVIWGYILMGIPLSMPGIIGFISLSGIVVNDSILMLEFIKMREKAGANPLEAAVNSGSDRFRALMLTSLTTIAGLLPILMEKSMQAQIIIPMAVSIVFGLTASTLLVLFVIPSFYTVIKDFSD
jgi:multidrug efflux pump subunit AcrB